MRNERITTKNTGQAQILFADQSSLTVAPNSELVIDEFIYDPKQHTGNMVASVTTGLLRYVGGKVSHEKDVTFNTPSAAITVRGGELIIDANQTGVTAAFVYGDQMCVSTDAEHKTCTTSYNTCLKVNNGQINLPANCPEAELDKWLGNLQGSNLEALALALQSINPQAGGNQDQGGQGNQGTGGFTNPNNEGNGGPPNGSHGSSGTATATHTVIATATATQSGTSFSTSTQSVTAIATQSSASFSTSTQSVTATATQSSSSSQQLDLQRQRQRQRGAEQLELQQLDLQRHRQCQRDA